MRTGMRCEGREPRREFEGPHETANMRAASGGSSRSYVAAPDDVDGRDKPGHDGGGARWAVRRLTPRECERLQGVHDDYTKIRWRGRAAEDCPDGPRYRALGNSWAVPVVRWIGARIEAGVRQAKEPSSPRNA